METRENSRHYNPAIFEDVVVVSDGERFEGSFRGKEGRDCVFVTMEGKVRVVSEPYVIKGGKGNV